MFIIRGNSRTKILISSLSFSVLVASTHGTNSTTGAGGVGCALRGLPLEQRDGAPARARRSSGANPAAAGDGERLAHLPAKRIVR